MEGGVEKWKKGKEREGKSLTRLDTANENMMREDDCM